MKLKSISLEAFRSFKDKNVISNLPDRGLCLIRGYNRDTGGSSGSGKSTIGLGVAHAFRFAHYAGTALQSWHTDKKLQVILGLEGYNGEQIDLAVGREQSITVDGEVTKGSATAVQEKLQSLTGLTPELMKALTYRPQQKPGLFLSMTDAQKKDFLSTLLGLEELEAWAETATKTANTLDKEADAKKAVKDLLLKRLAEIDLTKPTIEAGLAEAAAEKERLAVEVANLEEKIGEVSQKISVTAEAIKTAETTALAEANEKQKAFDARYAAEMQKWGPFVSSLIESVNDLKAALAEAQRKTASERAAESAHKRSLWEDINKLSAESRNLSALASKIPGLEAQIADNARAIETTSAATCPTCSQSWLKHEEHLATLKATAETLSKQLEEARSAESMIPVVMGYIEQKQKEADSYVSEARVAAEAEEKVVADKLQEAVAALRSEEADYQKKVLEVQMAFERERSELLTEKQRAVAEATASLRPLYEMLVAENDALRKSIDLRRAELRAAELRHSSLVSQGLANEKAYEARVEMHRKLQEDVSAAQAEIDELLMKANAEADFAALVGREGFLGSIFEEVLIEISAEANEYLKLLPNVSTTTVEFVTETETKKGTVQRKIGVIVTKNGVTIPLEEGLSGGQKTSVELAVDLAVISVIGRRTGKMPGWLILDESFEGHDVPVKEACLEILKKASEDKLIIVVDHATEVKEMFDFFITVESSGDISTIVS